MKPSYSTVWIIHPVPGRKRLFLKASPKLTPLHKVDIEHFVASNCVGYVTKCTPHMALKLISSGKLTVLPCVVHVRRDGVNQKSTEWQNPQESSETETLTLSLMGVDFEVASPQV